MKHLRFLSFALALATLTVTTSTSTSSWAKVVSVPSRCKRLSAAQIENLLASRTALIEQRPSFFTRERTRQILEYWVQGLPVAQGLQGTLLRERIEALEVALYVHEVGAIVRAIDEETLKTVCIRSTLQDALAGVIRQVNGRPDDGIHAEALMHAAMGVADLPVLQSIDDLKRSDEALESTIEYRNLKNISEYAEREATPYLKEMPLADLAQTWINAANALPTQSP